MKDKNTNSPKNKKKSNFFKILILAVVLAVVAVGGFILSDIFFAEDDNTPKTETVTVTVSGTDIYINGSERVTLEGLENYFTKRFENKQYCTIALINDTQHPADVETYNSVVDILGKFGINQEHLTLPSTADELAVSSHDET